MELENCCSRIPNCDDDLCLNSLLYMEGKKETRKGKRKKIYSTFHSRLWEEGISSPSGKEEDLVFLL